MGLLGNAVIMIQHFPATGNYIVHREGTKVEVYSSDDEIYDEKINRFLRECLESKLYHEGTVHVATGRVSGPREVPVKQIIYCKSFEPDGGRGRATVTTNINWILWSPSKYELTVNRGMLGVTKVARVRDLADAPDEIREFMIGCTDGAHVALSQHITVPDNTSGSTKMVSTSEYFFSTGKVIYGFQQSSASEITPAEMEGLGLKHL